MSHLASLPGFATTIPEMAEATHVPAQYLRKVLSRLRDKGIVSTQRGVGGGVRLEVEPDKLTILGILSAVDPFKRIERCPLGLPEHFNLCPLHTEINSAIQMVENVLNSKTLADLLAMKRIETVRCEFPNAKVQQVYELGQW